MHLLKIVECTKVYNTSKDYKHSLRIQNYAGKNEIMLNKILFWKLIILD